MHVFPSFPHSFDLRSIDPVLYNQHHWKQSYRQFLTSGVWNVVPDVPTFRIRQMIAKLGQTKTARSHDGFMVLIASADD